MTVLKQLLYSGLTLSPVMSLLRRRSPVEGVHVLMYHELAADDADIDAWMVLRRSDFLRQIEHVRRHYDLVSLDTALAAVTSAQKRSRPMAVVTFDDGDRGNVESLLPLAESEAIPATVYVATRQVADGNLYWFDRIVNALQTSSEISLDLTSHGLRRYEINRVRGAKNWAQISRLLEDLKSLPPPVRASVVERVLDELQRYKRREGFEIAPMSIDDIKQFASSRFLTLGAHSHCHNILTQLSNAEVEESVTCSKRLLEKWSGRPVEHFAYPNGSYNATVADIVRKAGFRTAVTTARRAWLPDDSLYTIPRFGVGRYDSFAQFKLNLVGGLNRFLPWRSARERISPATY